MQILEQDFDGYVTLTPVGELDANSSVAMDEKIEEMMNNGAFNIHVDCSRLTYISSAGLGVFISYLETMRNSGGKFVFSGMSEPVFKVFDLLGLPRIMKIVGKAGEVKNAFEEDGSFQG